MSEQTDFYVVGKDKMALNSQKCVCAEVFPSYMEALRSVLSLPLPSPPSLSLSFPLLPLLS